MGHRHFLGLSQLFDDEHDQGLSHLHPEHPYTTLGMPVSSRWNSLPGPNTYTASGHSVERPHYNPGASGPSHDPLVSSIVATSSAPHENYVAFAPSSNCNSQTWSNSTYVDQSMENLRGPQKRKSPCVSSIYEMGSSSQYHGDRTSSDTPSPPELHLGKSIMHDHDPHYMPWLMNPTNNRSHNLSIMGEGSSRNVRSRPTFDLETSLDRNNFPRISDLDSHSTHHNAEHSGSGQFPGHKEWNCPRYSHVPGELNGFSPETNNFLPVRSVVNSTHVDTTGYHHGVMQNRNSTLSRDFPGASTQCPSTSRFSHRSTPTYRSSSNGLQLGHVASSSGVRSHLVTETYPSRHLRPPPYISWRSGDRTGRRRSSYERFQPPFDEASLHERFSSEGYTVVDRQQHYGSRNMVDHHRELRLDIDNMTYEELVALGERIGSVNTGLSNEAISSCLLETTYYPLYQTEEERRCAICLEEYKEREELGEVKGCGHEYHGACIKKWLSMKNSCPICKSPALPDASNNP